MKNLYDRFRGNRNKGRPLYVSPGDLAVLLAAGVANLGIRPPKPKYVNPKQVIAELKAKAMAKRKRRAEVQRDNYVWSIKNNPCLRTTGKNWLGG